ncbi:MAG TPA: glycosyltransferase family 87 protein, partial [Gemmataceae bacterium]|nr:glycosyltransferase family 87 protein [Gemmataceae bacterium]
MTISGRTWFYLVLTLLFAIVTFQYVKKVLKPREDGHTQSAILRWAPEFEEMQEGKNIHAEHNYPNPPILPQLLTPIFKIIQFDPVAGALTWFFLKLGMAIICIIWSFRLVTADGQPMPEWAKAIAVAAAINTIIGDLKHGNVNIFILFLVMSVLYSYSRGKDYLSGLMLALAIASKVTPALFLVYFAWKRSWQVLIGAAVGLVLFFLLVPTAIFTLQKGPISEGWQANWDALTAWKRGMVDPYLIRGEVTSERENQSLPGVITRLFSHEPSFSKWIDNVDTPQAYHNVAELDRMEVKRIVTGCQAAFVLLMVVLCWVPMRKWSSPPMEQRRGWRAAAEYSFILIGMLLFSERTWKHHCVILMLPFAILSYGAFAPGFSRRVRLIARISLFTAMAATLLPTVAEVFKDWTLANVGTVAPDAREHLGLNPNSPRELAQVYGAYLWGLFTMLI